MNNKIQSNDVIKELIAEELIEEEQSERAFELSEMELDATSPWYVQLLIGTGAWISAILFGLFFALTGLVDSAEVAIFVGLILLLGSLWFSVQMKQRNMPVYPEQLLLACSFSGHILFLIGVAGVVDNPELIVAVAALLISIIFLLFYQSNLHKFISTWIGIAAIWFVLFELNINPVVATALLIILFASLSAWIWTDESKFMTGKWLQWGRPVQYALVSGFLIAEGLVEKSRNLFYWNGSKNESDALFWNFSYSEIVSFGFYIIFSFVIIKILKRLEINLKTLTATGLLLFSLILSVVFYRSPAIIASLIILIIGIERGNKILVPISVISLVYFYSSYYYRLDITLMDKSLILMGSGLFMLLAGVVIKHGGKQV